jgi:acyl-CoA hydrolase
MKGKTAKESATITTQIMTPQDVNLAGNVQGGVIMRLIDIVGGAVATRHARGNCVTASIDRLDFHSPVYPGDMVTFKASLNMVGKTSMEVGVKVITENLISGEVHHTASAYLTYVALDKDRRPKEVPSLILETDEERRRNREAILRRKVRLEERTKIQEP